MKFHRLGSALSCAARATRSSVWALILCSQLACAHAGYGGRAFGQVPLGSSVERYLRTVWTDFGSLEQAEESGRLWIEVDPGGMQTVKVPAEEIDFGIAFAGVQPREFSMSLRDGRIMSARFLYQARDPEQGKAIAIGIYNHLYEETGREPTELAPYSYSWPGDKQSHMMGIDTRSNRIVWGVASMKMMAEAREAGGE